MKKLFSFLTLLMLFMGSGTAWANFWSNGQDAGTWTLDDFSSSGTRQNLINTITGNGNWKATGKNQNTWKLNDEGGTQYTFFEGAGHLKVGGTVRIAIQDNDGVDLKGYGLVLYPNASISVECNSYYAVEVTATSASGDINCDWNNVRAYPESPQFTTSKKTQTVLYSGDDTGWVTMTNSGSANLTITEIKMYKKPVMYWSKNDSQVTLDKLDLATLDYVEPELQYGGFWPSGMVTLTSYPDSIVKIKSQSWHQDWNQGGKWVMTYELIGLMPGTGYVTASCMNGDQPMTATYRVKVDIDEYSWDTENISRTVDGQTEKGTRWFLTGEGGILNPEVTAVPFLTFSFGNDVDNHIAITRADDPNSPKKVLATMQDANGERAVTLDGNKIPVSGTFYTFNPQIDGTVKFSMHLHNNGFAVLVDAANPTTAVHIYPYLNNFVQDYNEAELTGGHTYYLYGMTPNTPEFESNWYYNPNDRVWTVAELNSFQFFPKGELVYQNKGVVYKNGKFYDIDGTTVLYDSPRQPIGGNASVDYVLEFFPDDTNKGTTAIASDGTLSIDPNFHGAIAVKASIGNNSATRDYYIVTVPYRTHDWWFTESVDPEELVVTRPAAHKQDFTSWGIAYKVLRPVDKYLALDPSKPDETTHLRLREEVKDPVLCSKKEIRGNNAGYAIQTAGLIIDAKPERFGVNTDMDYHGLKKYKADGTVLTELVNKIPIDQYEDSLDTNTITGALKRDSIINRYAYYKGVEDTYTYPTHEITMATYSSLIIPDLLEGQHIRIYWARHNKLKGDMYKAYGVTDLDGVDMEDATFYAGNGNGYVEFIAKGGNATFTLQQEVPSNTNSVAWTNIYRITVGEVGEFLDTELNCRAGDILYNPKTVHPMVMKDADGKIIDKKDGRDGEGWSVWGPMGVYNQPYMSVVKDNDSEREETITVRGFTGGNNFVDEFKIAKKVGPGTVTLSGNKIKYKGNGIVGLVYNLKSNGYTIDTDTLTVPFGSVHFQEYPHTWDFTKFNINTTSSSMLINESENGTGIDWYKDNETVGVVDESDFKLWQPATDVEGEWILNCYHKGIKSSVFAQGSELSAGFVPIEETKGLGIFLRKKPSGSYFLYAMADDGEESFSGNDVLRYGTTNGQGYLKFPASSGKSSIIRVPQVSQSKGERVYICADGTPTVYQEQHANGGNGSNSTITELAPNTDGNNSYFVPENDGDVYIDVTDMKVFKIGVTSTFKNLNTYNHKSYATESREHNERYDLTGYFTGDNVSAFQVVGYSQADARIMTGDNGNDSEDGDVLLGGKLALQPVEVADANTGVLLVGAGEATNGTNGSASHFKGVPLFVKDVNTDLSDTQNNLMKPSYIDGASNLGNVNKPYILTRKYTPADPNNPDQPAQGASPKTGPLAFYKMWSGELAEHLAYLDQPETTSRFMRYSLSEGQTFTSGQTVNVKNSAKEIVAKVTYGKSGGAAFTAAAGNTNVSGFTAYTAGNGANGNDNGSGTCYTIAPQKDGTMEVAVVLDANKAFYITEDGTPLTSYNGIKVTEQYFGTFTFAVTAGKKYMVYSTESEVGFYGFNYYYEASASSTNYDMFWFIDEEEGELDGIEQVTMEDIANAIESENAVYYNINGQKLNSKPTQRGIYICNGKKFYVK